MDVIGSSPVGPTVTNGGSELPNNPEAFEDDLGNPDWAAAGQNVSHSSLDGSELDELDQESAAESGLSQSSKRTQPARSGKFAAAIISGVVAFAIAAAAPTVLLELAPAEYRQSIWIYLGLLVGGLVASLLQFRNRSGLLPAAAAVYGTRGAKVTVLLVLAALGLASGAVLPQGDLLKIPPVTLLLALALVFVGLVVDRRTILRVLLTLIGLGYLTFTLAQSSATLEIALVELFASSEPDFGIFVVGLAVGLAVHLLVPMSLLLRLAASFVAPLALALFDLGLGTDSAAAAVVLLLVVAILILQLFPQILEMSTGRGKLWAMQLAALGILLSGIAVGAIFSKDLGGLIQAATLVPCVWALIQVPAVPFRKLALHRKSLALGYGFYSPISWIGILAFLTVVAGLFAGAWLSIPLEWLLIGLLTALVIGLGTVPGFYHSQAEHLAAEKRKNEPVRVSSEDLQWSD